MQFPRPLAFVDLETTGLGPQTHRIVEIGVVTLDPDGRVGEWQTLLDPGHLEWAHRLIEGVDEKDLLAAPRFAEVARALAERLDGRLFVAHNARFDYAFLKAEFDRAGVAFEAPALCTVMLSRKLYPQHASHSLDALLERFGIEGVTRHRALPDAIALHRVWQAFRAGFALSHLTSALDKLLKEPVLPPHLDPALLEALPQKAGVYLLRGETREALRVAPAANLRREAKAYFRLDRVSARGAVHSYKVRHIDWHVCEGALEARLLALSLAEKESAPLQRSALPCSLHLDPGAPSAIAKIVTAEELAAQEIPLFGLFASARKAGNALRKLVTRHGLCPALAGLEATGCVHCEGDPARCRKARPRHLVRAVTALSALRLPPWPYRGPIALREGRRVHVCDQWQWLGSARTLGDAAELVLLRPQGFSVPVFNLLRREIPRWPARRLKTLRRPAIQGDAARLL